MQSLADYLSSNGGYINPNLEYKKGHGGGGMYAKQDLNAGDVLAFCPTKLCVLHENARECLKNVASTSFVDSLSERQALAAYVALHLSAEKKDWDPALAQKTLHHRIYVDNLPGPEEQRTPLYFTPEELEFFQGSNMYGATKSRDAEWRAEYAALQRDLNASKKAPDDAVNWDAYLWAQTMLSSRAFPSRLVQDTPEDGSHAVLIPGVDLLNHKLGAKTAWICVKGAEPGFQLVLDAPVKKGDQVYNNYGPKSNEELLLGYGFVEEGNPANTLVLALGGPTFNDASMRDILLDTGFTSLRHVFTSVDEVPPMLLAQLRLLTGTPEEREVIAGKVKKEPAHALDFVNARNEAMALRTLDEMLYWKLLQLQASLDPPPSRDEARPDVAHMILLYMLDQVERIEAIRGHLASQIDHIRPQAQAQGFEDWDPEEEYEEDFDDEDE